MKIGAVMALSTALLVMMGCGNSAMSSANGNGNGTGPGAPMFDARGNWQITTQSHSGTAGGAAISIQQDLTNGSISGTASSIQPPCAASATLNGSMKNNAITLTMNENGQLVTFTGSAGATGTLSGTYTAAAGGCTNGDAGTWTASRTSGPK
jgi:hypothetical protein